MLPTRRLCLRLTLTLQATCCCRAGMSPPRCVRGTKLHAPYSRRLCCAWHMALLTPVHLQVLDLQTGQPRFTLYGHQGSVRSVRMAPAGDVFVTGGQDGRVLVWHRPPASRAAQAPVQAPVQQAPEQISGQASTSFAHVQPCEDDAGQAVAMARIQGQLDAVARTLEVLQQRVASLEVSREDVGPSMDMH